MLSFLKNHPFAVEAFFESSAVLTFAVREEYARNLIPECLQLDTLNNKWAFIAVAMVKTQNLRPKGFPKISGNDFFLIGYRVFVKYTNNAGKRLRGLYILKSETDKRKMEVLGNIFTHYNYTSTNIQQIVTNTQTIIQSSKSGFKIVFENTDVEIPLPANSPFTDCKEARKFAGPLPFTFTYNTHKHEVLIVEGVRQNWVQQPIRVVEYNIPFLETLNIPDVVLANAFIVHNIPYWWKKGKIEQWKK